MHVQTHVCLCCYVGGPQSTQTQSYTSCACSIPTQKAEQVACFANISGGPQSTQTPNITTVRQTVVNWPNWTSGMLCPNCMHHTKTKTNLKTPWCNLLGISNPQASTTSPRHPWSQGPVTQTLHMLPKPCCRVRKQQLLYTKPLGSWSSTKHSEVEDIVVHQLVGKNHPEDVFCAWGQAALPSV